SWNWYNEASLNFSYEFDFWGKNHSAVEAALGRAKASEVDAYAARVILLTAITQSYLRLEQAYALQELAETILKQRQQVLALTQQRVAAQIDSTVDLKQAELAIPLARDQIAQAKESIGLTRNQLAALLGAGPDRGLKIDRPHLATVAGAVIPSNLPSELIGRRPDVIAQRLRVEAFAKDIKVAKAQFYPNINLTAFIGFQSLGFAKFLDAGSQIAGVAPAISLPIFDGGRLRSNLAVRDAEYDIAVEQYNQTLVESMRDVVNQLVSIQWLAEHMEQQNQALKTVQEAYELSVQRYRSGLGNYLQVLATEIQVLAQQRSQIDLNARALDLDINLVRALGGGYQ
ncbi:MAG: efflux transporter outer membrane subunit, partial [Nitrosomonadales bacterium]|nr:efflux transporter outer membrane subunit [Nitrosomonadales bacterium]